jgi:hypothetical protein
VLRKPEPAVPMNFVAVVKLEFNRRQDSFSPVNGKRELPASRSSVCLTGEIVSLRERAYA